MYTKKTKKNYTSNPNLTPLKEGEPLADLTFRGGVVTKPTSESLISNSTPKRRKQFTDMRFSEAFNSIESPKLRQVGEGQHLQRSIIKPPLAKVRKSLFKVEEVKHNTQGIHLVRSHQNTTMTDMNK